MLLPLLPLALTLAQQQTTLVPTRIAANSNRISAGRMVSGELRVQLEARLGRWFPEGERDPSQVMQAFAEVGHAPQIPGPLIRVKTGIRIHASLHNTLDKPLTVYGLYTRPGSAKDTVQVAPGATRDIRFAAGAPGTYFYWGSTSGDTIEARAGIDSQLSGAIVVDSAGTVGPPRDRVFVLGVWAVDKDTTGPKPWVDRAHMVINGKSWPHTERFTFTVGDTVRWRWVNPTGDSHPMHLHGFYYDVASRGTWSGDTVYARDDRRRVATELLMPGGTMSTTWVAATAGSWLFHCHFAFHVSHYLSLLAVPDDVDPGSVEATEHAVHNMRGLVLGIDVKPRAGVMLAGTARATPGVNLRLLMQSARARYDTFPGYGFVLQRTPASIARDSVPTMSPTIVLRRNELARINVVNHLRAPAAVHWHGLELSNSYFDGVPGWSGTAGHRAPLIAPNDSFTVEITPPRAGTFMYHSHSNEEFQITSGLYGALIVLDDKQVFDSTTDRVFVIGGSGPQDKGRVNGEAVPKRQTLRVGTTYRVRIIQIQPDWRVNVSLIGADSMPRTWRAIAKDGADLPARQAVVKRARILMGPGETADFEFTPTIAGDLLLDVVTDLKGWRVSVPIHVEGR